MKAAQRAFCRRLLTCLRWGSDILNRHIHHQRASCNWLLEPPWCAPYIPFRKLLPLNPFTPQYKLLARPGCAHHPVIVAISCCSGQGLADLIALRQHTGNSIFNLGCTGDEEARNRGTQKSVLERKAPPTFPLLIEMRERAFWVTHWVEDSVDCLLHGKAPVVQVCNPEYRQQHSGY